MNVGLAEVDRAARRAAQTVFDRPVVLEAGAGTGKTTALVARLLAWTLGAGWSGVARDSSLEDERVAEAVLDGVVAITFTEAAAAEMAARAQRELAGFADGDELPAWLEPDAVPSDVEVRRRRARALLAAIDHLRVQTIHAFAYSLLRSHGMEIGLHPALEVDADESELRQVVLEVVGERLPARYREDDADLARLARDGFGPGALHDALVELCQRGVPPASLDDDPWTPAAIASLLEPAAAAARELAARTTGARFSARATVTIALAEALPGLANAIDAVPRNRAGLSQATGALEALCPEKLRNRLADWAKESFSATESDQLVDLGSVAGAAHRLSGRLELLGRIDPGRLDAARRVLAPLAAEVERRLRARGRATFSDLLRLAVDLVDRPAVAREIRRSIRQLLVDELQDTDELQCDLVARLALEGPRDERPGLFLVGDPKQSIYGWRRARLSNYFAFVERALDGQSAGMLAANFRSAEGVLSEVERTLGPVMAERSDVAAPFVPLLATGERTGDAGEIEFWAGWDAETGKALRSGESARREAAAIAADLALRIGAGQIEARDAAILLRSSTQVERFLDALRSQGVPYAVEKDRSYYRRRETIDAAALVRSVLDPSDRPALVAWLRSPAVGIPDAALLPLFRERLPELLAELGPTDGETLRAEVDAAIARAAAATPAADPLLEPLAGWPMVLRAAIDDLVERRRAFGTESASVWVDRLRQAFEPDLFAAARYQARHRLANLDRFFRELIERLESPEPLHRLLADLRSAARERPDEPEGRPLDGAGNAVRVMTIHSAKGLEFDTVYVASTHSEPRGRGAERRIEAERVGERWEYSLFGAPTPGLAPAADLGVRIRAAEQVRLLYVALTRPRRRLVISGAFPLPRKEKRTPPARSLGALLAPRLPDEPALVEWLVGGEAQERRDAFGIRWRLLPPIVESEAGAAADGLAASPEVDPGAALVAVVEARAAASAHAGRPRIASASELAELEADLPEIVEAGEPASTLGDRGRRLAQARGTALHRALELAPQARAATARWRAAARATFELELPDATDPEVATLVAELDQLLDSTLFAALEALAPRVLARELPILLRAPEAAAPIDAVTGTIDLVYRDEDGRAVIADFKSDAIADDNEVAALGRRYRPQLELYGRAFREALGEPATPRLELWLLALDRVVALEPEEVAPVDPR